MRVLALDTSTQSSSMALTDDGRTVFSWRRDDKHPPSDSILFELAERLKSVHVALETIDLFAAAAGPGSFTGLRVGLCAVKTFAFALRKPVQAVDGFDIALHRLVRAGLVENRDEIGVLLSGIKSDVYLAHFGRDGSAWKKLSADHYFIRPELIVRHWRIDAPLFAPPEMTIPDRSVTIYPIEIPAAEIIGEIACAGARAGRSFLLSEVQARYVKPISIGGSSPEWSKEE